MLEELLAGSGKLGYLIFHFYKMKDIISPNAMQEKNDKTPQKCFTLQRRCQTASLSGSTLLDLAVHARFYRNGVERLHEPDRIDVDRRRAPRDALDAEIADAMRAKTVVGVSPIIGGAPVRGMADACLTAIGVETTATAVAAHYGAGLLDGWLVDDQDKAAAEDPALAAIAVRVLPLYMTDLAATAEIARAALDLAAELM